MLSKQAHITDHAASSTPYHLRRTAILAPVRRAPLCRRELQRRFDAARRGSSAAWKGQRRREGTARRRSTNRIAPVAVLHITIAPASARKTAEAKRRYAHLCLCPRGNAMGEGRRCYELNQGPRGGGGGIFSSKLPMREKHKCQRTLSRARRKRSDM